MGNASISTIVYLVFILGYSHLDGVSSNEFCSLESKDKVCKTVENNQLDGNLGDSVFIHGGIVVNADRQFKSNVLIENGIITAVGLDVRVPAGATFLDATDLYVMPGGIDPHTHLSMPFMGTETVDDFYSGHAAGLAGGTTFHIDFVLPTNGSLRQGFEDYIEKSKIAAMDYAFHVAVTDWNEHVAKDMEYLVDNGINSFKFFMAYKGALQVTDEQLLEGFDTCKRLGALPQVHAENGDAVEFGRRRIFELGITGPEGHSLSRPPVLEGEATARAIKLAKFLNVPLYVVHVMSDDALLEIARARQEGQRVIGEPVISGLALDESSLFHPEFKKASMYVMSPPIRSKKHQQALKLALANGVLQLVGTDHCAFNSTQKALGRNDFRIIPNGVNGIGERMLIVWDVMVNSGLISPSDFVRITSAECAKIFNIFPRKGAVAVGSDADVIIFNPDKPTEMGSFSPYSNSDTNVYEGWKMRGGIEVTISRGRIVYQNGKLNVTKGSGRFVPLKPFGPLFRGLDKLDAGIRASYGPPVNRDMHG